MSKIDQLSIQGIRNFSSDCAEVIRFEPPVTLILGKNGSGKTTIIESLKYATTGEPPTGTDRGKSFIHDPKLSTNKMSIGCVKLQFLDEHNNKYIVNRSMEARFLKSKMDFKTTDGTISEVMHDGTLKSYKNKIQDLNAFVCEKLGVSKALLNNVLFCHQEDSNWPLDESKKVKEKFDDIFNTTRYVKCQDEIKKQINEVKAKMKDIERVVEHYKLRKDHAEESREEQHRQSERKSHIESEMSQLQQEKTEIEAKYKQAMDQYKEAEKINKEIQTKRQKIEELERNRKDLESDITRFINTSVEDLEREIKQFQLTKDERETELRYLQRDFQELDRESKTKASTQHETLLQLGKLQSEEEQHRRSVKKRDLFLNTLAHRNKWPDLDQPISSAQVSQYQNMLQQTIEEERNRENILKQKLEEDERVLFNSLNKLREECVRLEQDIKTKESFLHLRMVESSEVEIKLSDMEKNSRNVRLLEQQQVEAQTQLDIAKGELNVEKLLTEIENAKSEKLIQEAELDHYRSQLKKVMSQRDARVKLEMFQKELSSKKTQERRLMSREAVEDAIKTLLGDHTSKDNLLSYFNGRLNSISTSLSQKQQNLTKLGQKGATIEANLRNARSSLEKKQTTLNEYQQKLRDAGSLGASELENDISRLAQEIQELDDQRGLVHGSEKMYRHFIEKMEKQRAQADCPLCHREFDDGNETQMLIDELKERIHAMPSKKADYDRRIAEKKSRHSQLLELRPVAQSIARIDLEIPLLQAEFHGLEEHSTTVQTEIRELEECIESLKHEENVGKKAQSDIIQLDALKSDIKKLQSQVDNIHAQLGLSNTDSGLTVEEAQQQVENAESAYRSTTQCIESMNEQHLRHQSKLADLERNLNSLMQRKLQLNDSLQQRDSLLERKRVLMSDVENARINVEQWKEQLQPMVAKQLDAQAAHSEFQKKRSTLAENARAKVDELVIQHRQIIDMSEEIEKWLKEGKSEQLRRNQEEVEHLEKEKSILEQRKNEVQQKTSDLQLALSNCENEERNMRNNLRLIVNITEQKLVKQDLEKLKSSLQSFEQQKLVTTLNELQHKLERSKSRLSELIGTFQEIEKSIRELGVKLQREEYATADEKYLDHVKELEINQAISEDLSNFYNALEWALMKFHKERMSVINRMIREMWHSTYKGKDIDYVEIRAEESAAIGTARRQYNYRVVMVKNGAEMDMRGRCSAGQKVLASLIIRMALAEAFSSKCGVLALDEPTTNLDEENIASLSDTVLELSSAITRQKRKFQLIIITHDEKFLERMSRDKRMERFYRVDRNPSRFNASEIRQYDVMGGIQTSNLVKKMLK